jgi:phosphoesterase RecJ-like protein
LNHYEGLSTIGGEGGLMALEWTRLREIIESHSRFLITTHVRPDGDALGSELAMAALLAQKNKQFCIVNASSMPPRYKFMDPSRLVRHFPKETTTAQLDAVEVVLILDTSSWVQLGTMADFVRGTGAKKVIIDHHVSEDDMGAEVFKDTAASACGTLVAEAVDPLSCTMTTQVAEPLFVAIATDTGWFRFSSTDGRTLRIAARLIEAGVSVDRLYRAIYEEGTLARLRLLGHTLESMRVVCNGRVAYSVVRLADLVASGAVPQDSEDLVNYTLSMNGVELGLLFVEQQSDSVKVSFRAKGGIDCSEIAGRFGGGGHRAAAGATLDEPIAQAELRVLRAVESLIVSRS